MGLRGNVVSMRNSQTVKTALSEWKKRIRRGHTALTATGRWRFLETVKVVASVLVSVISFGTSVRQDHMAGSSYPAATSNARTSCFPSMWSELNLKWLIEIVDAVRSTLWTGRFVLIEDDIVAVICNTLTPVRSEA